MWLIISLLLHSSAGISPASVAGMPSDPGAMGVQGGQAAAQLLIPGIKDILSSQNFAMGGSMYERKTQAPMIWIKLRKSPPIVVDREFYNISNVPGLEVEKLINPPKLVSTKPKKKANEIIQQMVPLSLLDSGHRVDPQMIQNGLYLSQPLRQPAQETINIAAVEDVRSIQAVADYYRKKKEIKRLDNRFHTALAKLING